MAKRLLLETDKRLLWKLAWNFGWKGMLSVEKHSRLPVTGATVVYTLSIAAPSPMSSFPLVSTVNIYQGSDAGRSFSDLWPENGRW